MKLESCAKLYKNAKAVGELIGLELELQPPDSRNPKSEIAFPRAFPDGWRT